MKVAGDGLLELLVDVLRTADEADGAHPEASCIHSFLGGLNEAWVVGETEVVVGAEVDHFLPRADLDVSGLRGDDDALPFVEPSFIDGLEFLGEELLHVLKHSLVYGLVNLLAVGEERGCLALATDGLDHVSSHGGQVVLGLPVPFTAGTAVVERIGPRVGDALA